MFLRFSERLFEFDLMKKEKKEEKLFQKKTKGFDWKENVGENQS